MFSLSNSLPEFEHTPLVERLCNYERLLETMKSRGLDGIVSTTRFNLFYLTSFHPNAYHQDEPPHVALVISRTAPAEPVLLVAEELLMFFLHQPTWVKDIRPLRSVMSPLDLPLDATGLDRFIPKSKQGLEWVQHAREKCSLNIIDGLRVALRDLGLTKGKVGFDQPGLARHLGFPDLRALDGYGALLFVRQEKTNAELALLRQALEINQRAIHKTVAAWDRGMTWRELNYAYYKAAVATGGIVDDPRGNVFANPRGSDPAIMLHSGLEDYVIEPGMQILFDCHGTWNMYCWDGGKTWIVDDEPTGRNADIAHATSVAIKELTQAMRPGAKVSELQAKIRRVYRGFGLDADSVHIYFHGLGLSHSDLEQYVEEGQPYPDWSLENNMVVATHLLYPGSDRERYWVEDVVVIRPDGGESLYSWDFDPIIGR